MCLSCPFNKEFVCLKIKAVADISSCSQSQGAQAAAGCDGECLGGAQKTASGSGLEANGVTLDSLHLVPHLSSA